MGLLQRLEKRRQEVASNWHEPPPDEPAGDRPPHWHAELTTEENRTVDEFMGS